jgi:hypothetical protein
MSLREVQSSRSVDAPDVSLDGMTDGILRGKIEDLMEAFPLISPVEIRNALTVSNGSVDGATDVLLGSLGSSSSSFGGSMDSTSNRSAIGQSWNSKSVKVEKEVCKTLEDIENPRKKEKVAGLLELGIAQPIPFLIEVLNGCGWNINDAANILLSDSMSPPRSPAVNTGFDVETIDLVTGGSTSIEALAKIANASPLPASSTTKIQAQQYPGGIIPSFQISLRNRDVLEKAKSQQVSQLPSMAVEEIKEQNPELRTNSISGPDDDTEVDDHEESMQSKVAQLHDLLPQASKNRCESILQIYEDLDEAYDALEKELEEDGTDNESSSETEDDGSEASDGSEIDQRSGNDRNAESSLTNRQREKRRAETPVSYMIILQHFSQRRII